MGEIKKVVVTIPFYRSLLPTNELYILLHQRDDLINILINTAISKKEKG